MQKIFLSVSMFLFGFALFALPMGALAIEESDCDALTGAASDFDLVNGVCVPKNTGLSEGEAGAPVTGVVITFMQWMLYIFGFLAVIAFVVSGIMYLTAAGDENQTDKAKRQMIYSIIGVIVGLGGLIIINAVNTWLGGSATF